MAVNVHRVRTGDLHANMNEVTRLQIILNLTQGIDLAGNRELYDNALVHAGFQQDLGRVVPPVKDLPRLTVYQNLILKGSIGTRISKSRQIEGIKHDGGIRSR